MRCLLACLTASAKQTTRNSFAFSFSFLSFSPSLLFSLILFLSLSLSLSFFLSLSILSVLSVLSVLCDILSFLSFSFLSNFRLPFLLWRIGLFSLFVAALWIISLSPFYHLLGFDMSQLQPSGPAASTIAPTATSTSSMFWSYFCLLFFLSFLALQLFLSANLVHLLFLFISPFILLPSFYLSPWYQFSVSSFVFTILY